MSGSPVIGVVTFEWSIINTSEDREILKSHP